MMNALTIIFVGLITFLGDEKGRTAVAIDVSDAITFHGFHVQEHAAYLRVPEGAVVNYGNWPVRHEDGSAWFDLDGHELEIVDIDHDKPFVQDEKFTCNMPSLRRECPALSDESIWKGANTIRADGVASMDLKHGTLSAFCSKEGAISGRFEVDTTSQSVRIRASKKHKAQWQIEVKSGTIIELRNAPVADEIEENHFIAYYKSVATVPVPCTNLPFMRGEKKCNCPPPPREDIKIVSTVACSNSTFP